MFYRDFLILKIESNKANLAHDRIILQSFNLSVIQFLPDVLQPVGSRGWSPTATPLPAHGDPLDTHLRTAPTYNLFGEFLRGDRNISSTGQHFVTAVGSNAEIYFIFK